MDITLYKLWEDVFFFCEMGDLDELTTDGGTEGQRISMGE